MSESQVKSESASYEEQVRAEVERWERTGEVADLPESAQVFTTPEEIAEFRESIVRRVSVNELRARRAQAAVVENDAQGRVTPEWVKNLAEQDI